MEKEYLTVSEVCRKYSVTRLTVYRWIYIGELSAVKVGKCYRIKADDLETFIRNSKRAR